VALNLFLEYDMHQSRGFRVQSLKVIPQDLLEVIVTHAPCVPLEESLVHLGGHIVSEEIDGLGETLMDELQGPVSLLLVCVLSYAQKHYDSLVVQNGTF
jgi:hypothetical protein